jgi:hypothetical protein
MIDLVSIIEYQDDEEEDDMIDETMVTVIGIPVIISHIPIVVQGVVLDTNDK